MDDFLDYVLEQLETFGTCSARKMFGGAGIYHEGRMFALIGDGGLYMKVDDRNRGAYEAAGMEGFQPNPDSEKRMSYWEIPPHVLEDSNQLAQWAQAAFEVALRAKTKKRKPAKKASRKARSRKSAAADPAVAQLMGLGKVSADWLAEIGVRTRSELEAIGSVGAFRAIQDKGQSASLNLLYALEGALMEVRWDRLPPAVKQSLKQRVGRQ